MIAKTMSQIEELRAFVTIVETGSLTQAADRLNVAVSAVSRRLRDLELRLGAALIQRSTRRLYLNETGQVFFERCKLILSDLEDAQQEVSNAERIAWEFSGKRAPVIRVSAYVICNCQFMHSNPEVRIEMDLSDKRVDLIAEGFDVAIRIGTLTDSSLIARKISNVRFLPAAAPFFGRSTASFIITRRSPACASANLFE